MPGCQHKSVLDHLLEILCRRMIELFYFLVFAADGGENSAVYLCSVDNGLAGSVKMLRNTRNLLL